MYLVIGLSLLFGFLFLVNVAGTSISMFVWRLLRPAVNGWNGRAQADLAFVLRIAPLGLAILFVLVFWVPSFLMFEPKTTDETVGYKLAAIALVVTFGIVTAVTRIFASWWRTRSLTTDWLKISESTTIDGVAMPIFRLPHPFPVVAVVGVFRPRMFMSDRVLETLDPSELRSVIAHEAGHVATHDNFRRVLIRICGDMLVFPFGKRLEKMWYQSAELAADERAAAASPQGALDLASALVKIGKIVPKEQNWAIPLGAFLVEPGDAPLTDRVNNLIKYADSTALKPLYERNSRRAIAFSLGIFVLALLFLAFDKNLLLSIHSVSESLLAILQ